MGKLPASGGSRRQATALVEFIDRRGLIAVDLEQTIEVRGPEDLIEKLMFSRIVAPSPVIHKREGRVRRDAWYRGMKRRATSMLERAARH
jgi:hypothetical protein